MAAAVITLNESGAALGHVSGKIVMNTVAIAAQHVSVGFVPSRVELFNYTDMSQYMWQTGMTAGEMKMEDTDGTSSIATDGIVAFAGDNDEAPGFTIGTNADMTGTSEVAYFVAYR